MEALSCFVEVGVFKSTKYCDSCKNENKNKNQQQKTPNKPNQTKPNENTAKPQIKSYKSSTAGLGRRCQSVLEGWPPHPLPPGASPHVGMARRHLHFPIVSHKDAHRGHGDLRQPKPSMSRSAQPRELRAETFPGDSSTAGLYQDRPRCLLNCQPPLLKKKEKSTGKGTLW